MDDNTQVDQTTQTDDSSASDSATPSVEEQFLQSTTEDTQDVQDTTDDTQETSEETKSPPFHEHPRWKEMLEKNRSLEEQINQLTAQKTQAPETQQTGKYSPQMQSLIDEIRQTTKEEILNDFRQQAAQVNEEREKINREAKQLAEDARKAVGSDDLFESSFKPFVSEVLKKYPNFQITKGNLQGLVQDWRERTGNEPKSKVGKSSPKQSSTGKVTIDRNEDFYSHAMKSLED